MPLYDHFHGRGEELLPWPTMTQVWAVALLGWLNRTLPPGEYLAHTDIRMGREVEADVAEYRRDDGHETGHGANGPVATLPAVAPPAVLTIPAVFPDDIEVEVRERRSGRALVGVIELVSPGNLDRPDARASFVAESVAYLRRGVGLVVIDVVTELRANLHNELIRSIAPSGSPLLTDAPTYVAGYRPVHRRESGANEVEVWPYPAPVGEPVPAVPLALRRGPTIMLDLEGTYTAAIEATGLDPSGE